MATNNASTMTETAQDKVLNSRLQECPIAIVGMASVFAETTNLEQFWDNIVESVNGIQDVPEDRWAIDDYYSSDKRAADKTYCKRGGFLPEIDFDPMEFGLPPNILELTDITQLMSLVVARDVLADAGIADESAYDRDKVGITLGVGGGQKQIGPLTSRLQGPVLEKVLKASGVNESDRAVIIDKFKKAYIPWEENSFPGMLGNVIAGRIANRFDFGGTNCVVDAACAGSLAAIKMAVSDLLEYRSETMITGGVCCDNSPFMYMSFAKTPAFTDGDDIRPFDEDSRGMMIGEGVGMIAIKRLEDAERDGDRIYSVIKGIGSSSDGRFKSIYAPRPEGQLKALKRAYNDAGFDPRTCGLVEAHGTGTKAGDAAEFSGINMLFSENNDQKQHIALGSVKSQVGHTKAAAGTAGMIKAALALYHKVLPATINVDKPNPALDVENSPLYINSETRPWMPRADGIKRRAGISSFGFGGTNFHFVMEEYQATHTNAYRLNEVAQTILISAKNKSSLISNVSDWINKLDCPVDAQKYVFNALVLENPLKTPDTALARCGFAAKNAVDALLIMKQLLSQLESNEASSWSKPTGLYYRESGLNTKGKVVALFSGQGSQYVNMGRDLTCNFPSMLSASAQMDTQFTDAGLMQLSQTVFPIPVFNAEKRKSQDEALRLTQHAQPAIAALSAGLFNTFKQAGFKADFTAGHSFGELTALWAADVISNDDYMLLARSRGQAMMAPENADFDAGTMAAVVGDPAKVAVDIANIKDVSIANYNSNNQVVIAGTTAQVNVAFETLTAKGYKVVKLPVSAAFHTPLVGHAQKPFADIIDSVAFNSPSIPVFANGTAKAHSVDGNDIKNALKNHILESVHFNEEIDNLYDAGGRIFIEFGPKNVLTRLVDNILKDKDDIVSIAVNPNPKKSADLQLRLAAIEMAVLGLELDNIDPYSAQQRPTLAPKQSPLLMKLSGASFVSKKTEKAFADALNDGFSISPEIKIVEKEIIKEVIVEKIVEKIVYVQADGSQVSAPTNTSSQSSDDAVERSVAQIINHQSELLSVHKEYMQGPKAYAETFHEVLSAHAGSQALPESLDKTLAMYHEFQTETLRVHETYLNSQTANMQNILSSVDNSSVAVSQPVVKPVLSNPIIAKPIIANPIIANPIITKPVIQSTQQPASNEKPAPSAMPIVVQDKQTQDGTRKPLPTETVSINLDKIQTVMMDVVADKTGYPTEMLELSMDMEADLGIDSIKRVEILGAVQDEITDLPELNPEDLAELRTLGEIVTYMQSKATTIAPVASTVPVTNTATIDLDKIQTVMMDVVADKTGYPTEMLELSMDMEADLGIDSIKRVEILGAVQDEITDLPELNPEDLAELRTLGEIVTYMQSKADSATSPSTATVQTTSIDLNKIQTVMMDVVADKTGYPTEMLELSMDMEADLGIDSIKRVEILGAVQDEITDLPELNPEDLAELRTLGEIVTYMQSKAEGGEAPVKKLEVATVSVKVEINNDFDPAPSATVVVKQIDAVKNTNEMLDRVINGENLLLVDDGDGSTVRLSEKLLQQGWAVTVIKPAWVITDTSKSFSERVNVIALDCLDEDELKAILATQTTWTSVVYCHPKTAVQGIEYPAVTKQGLQLAFLLAKLTGLTKNTTDTRSSFVVLTRQGGAFGVENNELDSDLVQAGLSGLVKTLAHEWPSVFCRIVDLASTLDADKVANILFDELNDEQMQPVEVGFNQNGRLTLVGKKTDSYALESGNTIDENSLFLVSGGAKGVTAHCVIRLAQTYQSKFILLGRSQYESSEPTWANGIVDEVSLKKAAMQFLIASGEKPTPVAVNNFIKPVLANREITQTINAITTAGGLVEYVSADVTNSDSVEAAVTPLTNMWGDITGLIHGAGVLADKFIEQKTLTDFEAVYSTKMDGLVSMLNCCQQDKIKHLVLFSSAAGFYGNPGQSDYSIANEILNKTAFRFKALHPAAQVLSFNWGPWDGGMVTPELKRMFNDRGVYIIPLDAGAELLVSELSANSNRCPQILVGNDMGGEGESQQTEQTHFNKALLAANNPFFEDHQIGGNQVFPTVCAIAWMADICVKAYPNYKYSGIESYKLLKGIIFDGSQSNDVNFDLSVLSNENDQLKIEIKVSSVDSANKTVFHYVSTVILTKVRSVNKTLEKHQFYGTLPQIENEQHGLYENGTLFHGKSLQGITAVNVCNKQGLLLSCYIDSSVQWVQGEFNAEVNNVFANDLVYQAMLVWVRKELSLGSLPTATGAWEVYQEVPVDQPFYLKLDMMENKGNKAIIADILLISKGRKILAKISGAKVTANKSLNDLFLKEEK